MPATSRSDFSSPGIYGSTRCKARPSEPTNSAPRTNFLTFDQPKSSRRSRDPVDPSRQPVFGPGGLPGPHTRVTLRYVQRNSKARASTASKRREARPTQCSTRLMLAQRK